VSDEKDALIFVAVADDVGKSFSLIRKADRFPKFCAAKQRSIFIKANIKFGEVIEQELRKKSPSRIFAIPASA
jgi:hypothetical protein